MTVTFVGAGPGDPELITVKGKKAIECADVILYAGSLVNPEVLAYAHLSCRRHNSAEMDMEAIVSCIEEAVKNKRNVVRLHSGDPSIYGAIQEQLDRLRARDIQVEVIPGVSSFLAAAASLRREYTLPGYSQTVILTRLEGRTPVPPLEDLENLATHRASMVIFLSVHMLADVVDKLRKKYPEKTPVVVVEKASWPGEQVIRGNLKNIADRVEKAGIKKTALILVGDFLTAGDYRRSRLYSSDFAHGYRAACREGGNRGSGIQEPGSGGNPSHYPGE